MCLNIYYAGCDYVIALTHMRTPNDIRLAEQVPEVIYFSKKLTSARGNLLFRKVNAKLSSPTRKAF